jgi:hypothetical protein
MKSAIDWSKYSTPQLLLALAYIVAAWVKLAFVKLSVPIMILLAMRRLWIG